MCADRRGFHATRASQPGAIPRPVRNRNAMCAFSMAVSQEKCPTKVHFGISILSLTSLAIFAEVFKNNFCLKDSKTTHFIAIVCSHIILGLDVKRDRRGVRVGCIETSLFSPSGTWFWPKRTQATLAQNPSSQTSIQSHPCGSKNTAVVWKQKKLHDCLAGFPLVYP